ncbi:MAG: DUF4905 domain-containing protein [Bacteroidota bacterium]
MKLKKHFSYKSKYQIWRLLISDTNKLVIELRDVDKKEVFFSCYNLAKGKKVFDLLQIEEKYWIGIETLYKDMIFFHKYAKPDMPGHKQIIGFDIASKSVKWTDSSNSFLFAYNDKIYCCRQNFESRNFSALNYRSGILEESLGDDSDKINQLRLESNKLTGENNYLFTEQWQPELSEPAINKAITKIISSLDIVGNVEYTAFGNLLFFSFHSKILNGNLMNRFFAYNLSKQEIVLDDILNVSTNSLIPDSFFVFKNFLLVLKEKNSIIVYQLE